jgi:hypothetical protein
MGTIDPQYCPICGNLNRCGVAAGKGSCWCFSNPIPESVLEEVPEEARELACICESCAFGPLNQAKIEPP